MIPALVSLVDLRCDAPFNSKSLIDFFPPLFFKIPFKQLIAGIHLFFKNPKN